jgi:hypothetical protein
MSVGVIFIDEGEVERFRKDADLVNERIKDLYNIVNPIYNRLPENHKNEFKTFLASLYFSVAKTYHKIVSGNLTDVQASFRKVIEDYMHLNNGSVSSNFSPELFGATADLLYGTEILDKLEKHMIDIYGVLTGIDVRKIVEDVTENCTEIKNYLKGLKRTDNLFTLLYSIYFNSARMFASSIVNEECWNKDAIKTLAVNTLSSILPINNENPEYEKIVVDDELLKKVYNNIDIIYKNILAKVDERYNSPDSIKIVEKLKEIEKSKPNYII